LSRRGRHAQASRTQLVHPIRRGTPLMTMTPAQAREKLDAHVREIMQAHFHPETGTPFWLERAKTLGFDPLKDVHGFAHLRKFGECEDEWLRGGPVRRWVPKSYANRPIYVFETGGTTGIPKSRIVSEDHWIDYELFSDSLPEKYFPM